MILSTKTTEMVMTKNQYVLEEEDDDMEITQKDDMSNDVDLIREGEDYVNNQ